jgi:hypothetical protein
MTGANAYPRTKNLPAVAGMRAFAATLIDQPLAH